MLFLWPVIVVIVVADASSGGRRPLEALWIGDLYYTTTANTFTSATNAKTTRTTIELLISILTGRRATGRRKTFRMVAWICGPWSINSATCGLHPNEATKLNSARIFDYKEKLEKMESKGGFLISLYATLSHRFPISFNESTNATQITTPASRISSNTQKLH